MLNVLATMQEVLKAHKQKARRKQGSKIAFTLEVTKPRKQAICKNANN